MDEETQNILDSQQRVEGLQKEDMEIIATMIDSTCLPTNFSIHRNRRALLNVYPLSPCRFELFLDPNTTAVGHVLTIHAFFNHLLYRHLLDRHWIIPEPTRPSLNLRSPSSLNLRSPSSSF